MAIDISKICLTREALQVPPPIFTSEAGAVLDFLGIVRGNENGIAIAGLDYEAFPEMAEAKLRSVAAESAAKHGLHEVTMIHRVGFVASGDPSLFLRVSSSHREASFAGSREIIERLKMEVPIWKNPVGLKS